MKQKEIALATRMGILDAACRVVLDKGVSALTLDATAQEAGVSKGGLLYHFPSKNSLIEGMIERLIRAFDLALERELAKNNGDWLVAYINASFVSDPDYNQLSSALSAAIANNPELLKPLQDHFVEWQKKAEASAPSPEVGTIIRLTMDGLWLSDLLGFAPPTPAMRKKMLKVLMEMIKK
jgi:AcrR family transcriptional regulator